MYKDLMDKTYGRLKVIGFDHIDKEKDYKVYWLCQCRCGKKKVINGSLLRNGQTKSCGCFHSDCARTIQKKYRFKHGRSHTKVWNTFQSMKDRCNNSSNAAYGNYGGRGIKLLWNTFEEFYTDMGEPPTLSHSIDRIDNNGNYCKENCRWATMKEQSNNRRSCVLITFNGRTQNIKQWAEEIGISHKVLWQRLQEWSTEEALTRPHRFKKYKNWKGVKDVQVVGPFPLAK